MRFSDGMRSSSAELKRFLLHNLYRHPQVIETTAQAQEVVRELFARLPGGPRANAGRLRRAAPTRPRAVADYIAGMTDRFAAREQSG